MTRSQYLESVLRSYRMGAVENLLGEYRTLGHDLKADLRRHYGLYNPYNPITSGSLAKATSIAVAFDLDIVVPFPYSQFGKLEDMIRNVYEYFDQVYRHPHYRLIAVRNQTWSIGLTFQKGGHWDPMIKIDIVPGRELGLNRYPVDKMLHLKNSRNERWLQTNIQAQINAIRSCPENTRKIIRLLKIWKHHRKAEVKSFLIELASIRAFKTKVMPTGIDQQLLLVLRFLQVNLYQDQFRLMDPGNSSNNVLRLLTPLQRRELAVQCKVLANILEKRPAQLPKHIPLNTNQ